MSIKKVYRLRKNCKFWDPFLPHEKAWGYCTNHKWGDYCFGVGCGFYAEKKSK